MRFDACTLLKVTAASCIALLSGCAQTVPDVPVAEQWTKTINNYSFIPVYPMREDVFVGDVRLTVAPDSLEKGQLSYRRLGYVDLRPEMEAFYRTRPSLPPTKVGGTDGKFAVGAQPVATSSIFATTGNDENLTRMRLAALPGIKVATIYQGQVGGRVPVGALNLGFGVTGRNGRVLDISLTGIEELEAPSDQVVLKKFRAYCKSTEELNAESLDFALRQLVKIDDSTKPKTGKDASKPAKPQVAVFTRVLYARSIDFTFSTEQGYAADVGAVAGSIAELSSLVGKPADGAPAGGASGTPKSAAAPGAESAGALLNSLAGASGGLLSSVSGSTAPGIVAKAVFVDSRGITLRETFERPMAFAAQAIGFDASTPAARQQLCTGTTGQTAEPDRPFSG